MPALKPSVSFSSNALCLLIAVWISATGSHGFWSLLLVDGLSRDNWLFAASLALSTTALVVFVLRLLTPGKTIRLMLSLLLIISACASWFIDSFGISVDREMLRNVIETDVAEASAFLGVPLLWRLTWQAALPILLIWKLPLSQPTLLGATREYAIGLVASIVILLAVALPVYVSYASFFRNHEKPQRLLVPSNVLWAGYKLARSSWHATLPFVVVGADATRTVSAATRPLLTLLVVGETARAANFSLGGYTRPTNPLLHERKVFYFSHVQSCGTATAYSVPCIFSDLPRVEFDLSLADHRSNVLDILQTAGLGVTWIDNQSGCKEVCARVPTERASQFATTPCSHDECLDEVLLSALEAKLPATSKDSLLVMHSMGSHGPTYYQRMPPSHEQFKPVCATARIETCTTEEIVNSYDNSILYTDYVLAGLIDRLEHQNQVDAVLIYISDHGESLGEHGLYLHGEPFSIAPDVQKHVPMLMWFTRNAPARLKLDETCLRAQLAASYTHDNLSHTLLGLNDVSTKLYRPELDLLRGCRHG